MFCTKGSATLRQLCLPVRNRACCRPSRGRAPTTRGLSLREEPLRTSRLPWFSGLRCAVRRTPQPDCVFLLICLAFNLFDGTGYFLFSGFTNFGDWAVVIAGLPAHWLWRFLLVVVGISSYFAAVLVVGSGLVRYVGVPRNDSR